MALARWLKAKAKEGSGACFCKRGNTTGDDVDADADDIGDCSQGDGDGNFSEDYM